MGSMTIQNVIDLLIAETNGGPLENTVDVVKAGDPSLPVSGIVTTFLATRAVIERAIDLEANLVITHEPVFYSHEDQTDWLEDDPVYQAKRRLIDDHRIVVWRFHDYWHRNRPDGIYAGVLRELGWEVSADSNDPSVCSIPPQPLSALVGLLKQKLGAQVVRVTGDPDMICRRVALSVGSVGGRWQIRQVAQEGVDVIVCGEINEWETCEYVRDAMQAGMHKGLIVVGHANSEEAGMKWLVDWLSARLSDIPITHVPAGDPLCYL